MQGIAVPVLHDAAVGCHLMLAKAAVNSITQHAAAVAAAMLSTQYAPAITQ
jgi:hypothetical protein